MTPILDPPAKPGVPESPPGPLLDEIGRGPIVLDAAMGTRLARGGRLDLRVDDPCLWNLDHPDAVLDVHRRDAEAGARALLTNTFGAHRARLARLGRAGEVERINRAGIALARRAAGPSGLVIGDLGASAADEPGAAREQAEVLVDAGADALILETFLLEPALATLGEIRSGGIAAGLLIIVSLWRWPDPPGDAARRLADAGAGVIGLNCRPSLRHLVTVARRLAEAVALPLLAKPGVAPDDPEPDATPAAFAAAVPPLVAARVRLIGGCCGTTEAHVAALAAACNPLRNPELHQPSGDAT